MKGQPKKCPKCDGSIVMVEYNLMDKYHYDGVSEYRCVNGDYRQGRWCGKELHDAEVEKPFCAGPTQHARVYPLDSEADESSGYMSKDYLEIPKK